MSRVDPRQLGWTAAVTAAFAALVVPTGGAAVIAYGLTAGPAAAWAAYRSLRSPVLAVLGAAFVVGLAVLAARSGAADADAARAVVAGVAVGLLAGNRVALAGTFAISVTSFDLALLVLPGFVLGLLAHQMLRRTAAARPRPLPTNTFPSNRQQKP